MSESTNKYDTIDYRLNILYDYLYNEKSSICYKFHPIAIQNLSIEQIKTIHSESIRQELFKGDIKFIGYSKDKWHFKRLSDTSYPCTISVGKYANPKFSNEFDQPENVDMLNLYVLSEMVLNEGIKYVILPILNFEIYNSFQYNGIQGFSKNKTPDPSVPITK